MTDLRFPAPDGTVIQIRAALLCLEEGKLLTCWDERYPEFHFLPGGAVQTGEQSLAAARREWREETGQEAAEVTFCAVVENFFQLGGLECHEIGFYYRMRLQEELPERVLDNPAISWQWLPVDELNQVAIYPTCLLQLLQVPAGKVRHFVTDRRV